MSKDETQPLEACPNEKLARSLEGYAKAYDRLHRDIADDFRRAAAIVRASTPKPLPGQVEATRELRCPGCCGRTFTAYDRELPEGGYVKTLDRVRCVNCKSDLPADDVRPSLTPAPAGSVAELQEAGHALLVQINAMIEATKPIFAEMWARGSEYDGPKIGDELEAFRTVLAKLSGAPHG